MTTLEILAPELKLLLAVSGLRDHVLAFRGLDETVSNLRFEVQNFGVFKRIEQRPCEPPKEKTSAPSIVIPSFDSSQSVCPVSPPSGYAFFRTRPDDPADLRLALRQNPEGSLIHLRPIRRRKWRPNFPSRGYFVSASAEASIQERYYGLGVAVMMLLNEREKEGL